MASKSDCRLKVCLQTNNRFQENALNTMGNCYPSFPGADILFCFLLFSLNKLPRSKTLNKHLLLFYLNISKYSCQQIEFGFLCNMFQIKAARNTLNHWEA